MKILMAMTLLLTISGCATNAAGDFPSIKLGMEKASVVERLGSPYRTEREHSEDVWVYRFYDDNDNWKEKAVIFESGKVVYTGVPITHESVLKGTAQASQEVGD